MGVDAYVTSYLGSGEVEAGDHQVKASPGKVMRLCPKNKIKTEV
jgi:hypothetical protein